MFSFFSKPKEAQKLFFHTDVHCHVVPGVDDGSPSVEVSLDLLSHMVSWGLTDIVATPHMTQDTFENTPDTLNPAFAQLVEAVEAAGIPLTLRLSAEHRLDEYFEAQMAAGLITPFPNNYLLVENSFVQEPWNLDQILFDLKLKGYQPIMAHPERFYYYQDNRQRYDQLKRAGTLMQINLLSLAGHYGKHTRQTAEWLIGKGYVDFIGTDLHNHKHVEAIEEYLASKDYRRLASSGIKLLNDTAFI